MTPEEERANRLNQALSPELREALAKAEVTNAPVVLDAIATFKARLNDTSVTPEQTLEVIGEGKRNSLPTAMRAQAKCEAFGLDFKRLYSEAKEAAESAPGTSKEELIITILKKIAQGNNLLSEAAKRVLRKKGVS